MPDPLLLPPAPYESGIHPQDELICEQTIKWLSHEGVTRNFIYMVVKRNDTVISFFTWNTVCVDWRIIRSIASAREWKRKLRTFFYSPSPRAD